MEKSRRASRRREKGKKSQKFVEETIDAVARNIL